MQTATEPAAVEPSEHDLYILSERQKALEAMFVVLAANAPRVADIIKMLEMMRDMTSNESDPPRREQVEVYSDAIQLLRRVKTSRDRRAHG